VSPPGTSIDNNKKLKVITFKGFQLVTFVPKVDFFGYFRCNFATLGVNIYRYIKYRNRDNEIGMTR